jgi:glutamate/aspartate transport system substrate-binding protein
MKLPTLRCNYVLCFAALFCVNICIAKDTLSTIRDTKTIRLGVRDNSAPFSFLDSNKRARGYTVEICEKIVQDIKLDLKLSTLEIVWVSVSGAERITAIRSVRIDLECGNTTNNPERRKDVAFAIPTFIDGLALISPSSAPLKAMSELSKKRVAVGAASPSLRKLTEQNQKYAAEIVLSEVTDNTQAMQALEQSRLDGWMTDQTVLRTYRATAVQPTKWHVSEKRFSVEPLAIMVRKEDPLFLELVNKSIRKLMLSGELKSIYARWFTQPMPERGINLEMPMSELLSAYILHPTSQLPENF